MATHSVFAVFADTAEAERIGRRMIDEQLAACVNILGPCRSFYRWDGRVETAEEVPAIFKTTADKVVALVDRIAELHSYDTPAVTAWPTGHVAPPYAKWVEESVG